MKLLSTLALVLLIAVSIQGAPTMEELEERDVSVGQLSFSPSNGSIDDLLKELNIQSLPDLETDSEGGRSKRDVCSPVGPFGGSGGGAFIEMPDNCHAFVSEIYIRSGHVIDAIQLTYQYSDGSQHKSNYHGGRGGSSTKIILDVSCGERVIGVFGRSGAHVDRLAFITNKGRIFGPYGRPGGSPFTVNSCNIKGIHGRAGEKMDSIGFYCDSVV